MGHISGGAISGIVFGSLLFALGTISLLLWWRRVWRDHYSSDPNAWGGSWGAKAQAELQAKLDRQAEIEVQKRRYAELDKQRDIELGEQQPVNTDVSSKTDEPEAQAAVSSVRTNA